jgi:hypothetical protein
MYIFEAIMKRRIFDTPFDLIKEKGFHLIVGSLCRYTFYELRNPKLQAASNHSIFRKTVFRNRSLHSLSFKIFMQDIWASKSLVPTVQPIQRREGDGGGDWIGVLQSETTYV